VTEKTKKFLRVSCKLKAMNKIRGAKKLHQKSDNTVIYNGTLTVNFKTS